MSDTQETLTLYNPSTSDFHWLWYDDANVGHDIVLPSGQATTLPIAQGRVLLQHLVDHLDFQRGGSMSYDLRRKKIEEEVVK